VIRVLGNRAVVHLYVIALFALFAIISPTRAQPPSDELPINEKFWLKPGLPSPDPKIFLPLPKCTLDPGIYLKGKRRLPTCGEDRVAVLARVPALQAPRGPAAARKCQLSGHVRMLHSQADLGRNLRG